MQFGGELAALGTAACWGIGSNFFVAAGRRMGSQRLNRLRLTAALLFLCTTLWFVKGSPWPTWAARRDILLLGASGLVGFVLGDRGYFRSLVILGAGRATLISSTSAIFAVIMARIFLHETLGLRAVGGIALTLGGLAYVMTERLERVADHAEGSIAIGIASGALSALLSLVALQRTETGVATALMSAHPLVAILIAARAHGERLTRRLLLGALITLAGVALLFLR